MGKRILAMGAAAVLAGLSVTVGTAQAEGTDVKIVLPEDLDLLEPCMATRSNIGRVIFQNVSETLTEYDAREGSGGVLPRLADGDGCLGCHVRGCQRAGELVGKRVVEGIDDVLENLIRRRPVLPQQQTVDLRMAS